MGFCCLLTAEALYRLGNRVIIGLIPFFLYRRLSMPYTLSAIPYFIAMHGLLFRARHEPFLRKLFHYFSVLAVIQIMSKVNITVFSSLEKFFTETDYRFLVIERLPRKFWILFISPFCDSWWRRRLTPHLRQMLR